MSIEFAYRSDLKSYNLSKEQRLILVLCDRSFNSTPEIEKMITDELDWTQIFTDSMWHKVLFIVLENLITSGLADKALRNGNLPLMILNHWKQLMHVNSIRNDIHFKEVKEMFQKIRQESLSLAVSKGGIALIGKIYTMNNRKMYDIDLIGKRDEHKDIVQLFNDIEYKMGSYQHSTEELIPLPKDEVRKWLLHTRGLPNFVKMTNSDIMRYVIVQVQYQIGTTVTKETIPSELFLTQSIDNQGIQTVSDVDLLLQLVLHLYRETKEDSFKEWNMDWNLIKFCDLDRFIHYIHDMGLLDEFFKRAIELNLYNQCIYSMELVNIVFPSDITSEGLNLLKSRSPSLDRESYTPEDVFNKLFKLGKHYPKPSSKWSELMEGKTI